MQTALLYFRGSGFTSAFIRWWTKSQFAHVAPASIFDDGTALIYDAYWSTGVTERDGHWHDADDVQVLPFNYERADAKDLWLHDQCGKKYDRTGLFVIGLTKRFPGWLHLYDSSQGEWLCSRLAAVCAEIERECWGLAGPPSPEDCHRIVAAKYTL